MNIYQQIEAEIKAASNIVITSHKSADGDSIGSSLGLLHFIEKLGKTAKEVVEQLRIKAVEAALEHLKETLDHELGRLAYLFKRNKGIRPDEIHTALDEKSMLTVLIENAHVRIDSLQLIREGEA